MNFQKNEDLTCVFDKRWRANHENNEKVQE